MLIKRKWSLTLSLLVLAFGIAAPFRSSALPKHAHPNAANPTHHNPPHHNPTKYEKILHNVGELLAEIHYSPRSIDDSFSREVFKKYLAAVDPEKKIFLQSDINSLRRFENTIDDEINGKAPSSLPRPLTISTAKDSENRRSYTRKSFPTPSTSPKTNTSSSTATG